MLDRGVELLADLVGDGGVTVLSGAGLSTDSGIPDYRSPRVTAEHEPKPAPPMTVQTFVATYAARRRYWARSTLGWPQMAAARPNSGHRAVTALQRLGLLCGVITQNVDGLHTAAGTRDVLELHGRLADVICLGCGDRTARAQLQERLAAVNDGWTVDELRHHPDGDVELAEKPEQLFRLVDCERCGGVLKPDVVMFGEGVPQSRVDAAFAQVESGGCLLVLGSSLTVMSGYRFVLRAVKLDIPIAIVNDGPTRGDHAAALRLTARLGVALPALVERLEHSLA
ncbi:MAG: NAD-dependent protein deacetylase [Mycobacteriales bacterium]